MAIQKEIWIKDIRESLFPNNSFLAHAFNADEYVEGGKVVHIPNAGAPSGIKKNRSSYPADVTAREDIDLTFKLDEFTTNPIRIPHADTVELSYDKRESVLRQDKAALQNAIAQSVLYSWLPSKEHCVRTTGKSVVAHTAKATGNRKSFTKADVAVAMKKFNAEDVPQEGRYLLLDAEMYQQLLNDLTTQESQAFFSCADVAKGVLGKLMSFNIMMRSTVAVYNTNLEKKAEDEAGNVNDCAAALVWHENSVCRAVGDVKAFEKEGDPTFYGDIYSFLARCGGRSMRSDVKGLLAIVQEQVE